jgi:hypothetical protein
LDLISAGIAAIIILATGGLITLFALPGFRRKQPVFRHIAAIQRLQRAVGQSVEDGTRIHIGLGKSSLLSYNSASSLVGLTALERIALLSLVSDRPLIATSGDGALSLLSQDALKAAYRMSNTGEHYDPALGRLAGATPFSYLAGAISVIRSEHISTNLLIGNFGPEVGLMIEADEQQKGTNILASDSLPAQAVMFGMAQDTMIGEELFALPAYLQAGTAHTASLRTQDVLRWVIIAVLIGGAILKFMGLI